MNRNAELGLSKVPEVTLGFWIIKIAATTLGETGGDSVTMTLNWGYLAGTALFLGLLVVLVIAQIVAKKFHLSFIGSQLLLLPPSAPRWRTLQTARLVSATLAVRSCCWAVWPPHSAYGIGRRAPSR